MKKLLVVLASPIIALALAGCDGSESPQPSQGGAGMKQPAPAGMDPIRPWIRHRNSLQRLVQGNKREFGGPP